MKDWQAEYLNEYARTTGKIASIRQQASWYFIITDLDDRGFAMRKSKIIEATNRLKTRPTKETP